jgi:hypothetical protein
MPVLGAEKDASPGDRRLAEHRRCVRHAERPFDLEPRKISRAEPWRRLEPPILNARTPAIVRGRIERKRRRGIGALSRHRRLCARLAAGHIFSESDAFVGCQR